MTTLDAERERIERNDIMAITKDSPDSLKLLYEAPSAPEPPLPPDPANPERIVTIRGLGYKYAT